jgi:hypothetical protein
MKVSELKPGDVVRVSRNVTVKDAGQLWAFNDTDGNNYVEREGASEYRSSQESRTAWDVELVDRPEKKPVHWPAQEGDVWKASDREYFIFCPYAGKMRALASDSQAGRQQSNIGLDELLGKNPVLIHRKGNTIYLL